MQGTKNPQRQCAYFLIRLFFRIYLACTLYLMTKKVNNANNILSLTLIMNINYTNKSTKIITNNTNNNNSKSSALYKK